MPLSLQGPFITRYDISPTPGVPQSGRECVRTIGSTFNVDGTPDWTIFDRHAAIARAAGVPLLVGLTNSNPWDPKDAKAVPAGVPGTWVDFHGNPVFAPNESDPTYQRWWDRIIKAFGAHFNGKAIVEGRHGCGGEGTPGGYHSPCAPGISADAAVFMMKTHAKYFPDSPIVAMTDNRDSLEWAVRNIPGVMAMRCSLGNDWFDAGLELVKDLLVGVPLLAEPYGGSGTDPAKVLAQIAKWKIKAVFDWNWGGTVDAYTTPQKTAYVKSVGTALALVSSH